MRKTKYSNATQKRTGSGTSVTPLAREGSIGTIGTSLQSIADGKVVM